MQQPLLDNTLRFIRITCFTCKKNRELTLRFWELAKKIECPVCHKKEVVIKTTNG